MSKFLVQAAKKRSRYTWCTKYYRCCRQGYQGCQK